MSLRPPSRLLVPVLVANVGIGVGAMTLCLPAMLEWEVVFHASHAAIQATYGAYLTTFALGQLVCGPLSDAFGRRPVLLGGLLLFVLTSLGLAFAGSIEAVILGRALQGAGACATIVVARALVQDCFTGPERTRVLAYTGIAMGVTAPMGAVLGGILTVRFGWPSALLAAAALGAVLAVGSARAVPRTRKRVASLGLGWVFAGYARLLRLPIFFAYALSAAGCTAAFYAFAGGAPKVLSALGVGADAVGWYLFFCSGAYMAGNWLTSRLARRLSDGRLAALGQMSALAGAAAMLAVALLADGAVLPFVAPAMLVGLGHGLIQPAALKGATGISAGDAGAAAALSGAAMQGSGALAGYALGLLPTLDRTGMAAVMLAATLVSAAATVPFLRR